MKYVLAILVLLTAGSAFGQQSTTDTTCNVNGQQVNCTSNTTSTGSTDAQRAEQQREMNESAKRVGTALGSVIGNKILKHRVNNWCEGHPDGSWNFPNGQNVTCFNWNEAYQPAANAQLKAQHTDQMLTIAVASRTFCNAHPDQSWTGPISGKVTPCGQLIVLQDVECSRNPELAYCKAFVQGDYILDRSRLVKSAEPVTPAPPATPAVTQVQEPALVQVRQIQGMLPSQPQPQPETANVATTPTPEVSVAEAARQSRIAKAVREAKEKAERDNPPQL
jgi:hypothetical protein